MPQRQRDVIQSEIETFKAGASIQDVTCVPDTGDIPSNRTKDGKTHWSRIRQTICVFADMRDSTALSAKKHAASTAKSFQLFTQTAVRLFHSFDAAYIDVRGDGAFALFDGHEPHRALAAAVSFKTFAKEEFIPRVAKALGVDVGCHLGIDRWTVLVRKVGIQPRYDRTDRQNEVWAGRPVNMAAKLASLASDTELLVSDRYWNCLTHPKALNSCGCPYGTKSELWSQRDLSLDQRFDFETAYVLGSNWCGEHGSETCEAILAADD